MKDRQRWPRRSLSELGVLFVDASSLPHGGPEPVTRCPVLLRGRVVGHHDGHTFYRTFQPEHVLQKPPAIALHDEVLRSLADAGVTTVELTSSDGESVYTAPLDAFYNRGVRIARGHGDQRALPLTAFFCVTVSQPLLPGRWTATKGGN